MECQDLPPLELIDIRGYSFDKFVAFVFDRQVPVDSGKTRSSTWYWGIEVDFDVMSVAEYYIRLFRQPEFLRQSYSDAQLDQGFWAIQSANLDCSTYRIMWDTEWAFGIRAETVRSMYDLFSRLFMHAPLETAVIMWWDSLCYDWHCGNRKRENGGEDRSMQDVMFETLGRILSLNSEHCQFAALHGLGHLHHPATGKLVSEFLATNSTLNEDLKDYARAASRFAVL